MLLYGRHILECNLSRINIHTQKQYSKEEGKISTKLQNLPRYAVFLKVCKNDAIYALQ